MEYRTAAVYHATRSLLEKLDNIQARFLGDAGVDDIAAMIRFNLAPLRMRRDIAMLGIIQRAVLGKGPPHFREHFKMGADGKLLDPRASYKHPYTY